ncbi:MAG: hypothetical protein HY361_01055 [Candidatus Aenigmarchaeota archaeon]|nr:hypothetical protein [Candidatus Aenigmarchaeota archaeon]
MVKANFKIVIIVIILAAVFLAWVFLAPKSEDSTFFGGLSGNFISNPLEKVPELNPLDKVNPFKDIFKNPFE